MIEMVRHIDQLTRLVVELDNRLKEVERK
jgi:hypothetical protein